jgi:hypothetical protein
MIVAMVVIKMKIISARNMGAKQIAVVAIDNKSRLEKVQLQ